MKFYPTYFYPRSGSTVVDHLLGQHPDVVALNEPFNPTLNQRRYNTDIDVEHFMRIVIDKIPADQQNKKNTSFQYCTEHLKQFLGNTSDQPHFSFIQKYFTKLVVIRRKNLLKQWASWAFASAGGPWIWYVGKDACSEKIKLPLVVGSEHQNWLLPNTHHSDMSLIEFLTEYQNYINQSLEYLKSSNIVWLDIVYEDHIEQDPLTAVKMIENFLQITPYNQYSIPIKKIANTLEQDLTNFDEVVDYLQGSEYEWMLY